MRRRGIHSRLVATISIMNRLVLLILFLLALMAVRAPLMADEDVRRVKLRQQGLKVIEEKCLVCHSRARIDEAMRERRELEKIMRRMEQKGAVLTEREREVMGHFWQQKVFKGKGGDGQSKPHGDEGTPR